MSSGSVHRGYRSRRLLTFLERKLEGFTDLPIADRMKFCHLFTSIYHNLYPHKIFAGYSYIPQTYYRDLFGRKNNIDRFNIFLEKYDWLKVIDTYRYNSDNTYGKPYKLSATVHQLMERFTTELIDQQPPPTQIIRPTGKKVHTIPENAIRSVDHNGNKAKCRATIPSVVEINTKAVHEALVYTKQLLDSRKFQDENRPPKGPVSSYFDRQSVERLKMSFSQILALHDLCFTSALPFGTILQSYVESNSGRLYGQGLSLQSVVREVRKVALSGLPYCEYDFSNCHFNILYQVAQRAAVKCPDIKYYLQNKNSVRRDLAREINLRIKDVKRCLLSLIYGARSVPWEDNAIPKIIGINRANNLFHNPFYTSLKQDIEKAESELIAQANKRGNYIINKMHKSIKTGAKKSEIIAHLLQGYEAKMLNIALELFSKQIIILQHDGWVGEPDIDTCLIRNRILRKLNLDIPIELKMDYNNL